MKKFLVFLFVLVSVAAESQIRFNVTTADPVTGKRIKYTNVEVRFQYGQPIEFIGSISFHETNDDPATPSGNTVQAKRVVESYMEDFSTNGKFIDPATKLYVAQDAVGAVALGSYLANKAYNSFPGTVGGDGFVKGIEGLCKELFVVRKANGEFVN